MERELWSVLSRRLDALPRSRPPRAQFSDREVVRVILWAALHDRPISWACRPSSWPRRGLALPGSSTVSRRSRTLSVMKLLRRLLPRGKAGLLVCVDGKPLPVGVFSKDRQAIRGHAGGGKRRGYKLHAACDRRGRIRAFDVRPMNESECTTARKLVTRAAGRGAAVLADGNYDSNALYGLAASRGARMTAPRRKAGRSVSVSHRQHPDRLTAIDRLESGGVKGRQSRRLRTVIERVFGWLTMLGGGTLPPWVRTLRRVRRWITAKIAILDAAFEVR